MVQCLRICLPMQGTGFPFLGWEDSTCLWATKLMCLLSLHAPELMLHNKQSHSSEKPVHTTRD